jgi:hypothetical protein
MYTYIQITYCYRRSLYNYNNQAADEVEIIIETNAQINECKSIFIDLCIFVCIYINVCIHVYIYIYMYINVHIHIYMYMYIYI